MFVRIDYPSIVLVGPAGSGKSNLAKALMDAAIENREIYPLMVNLDPGVEKLPYEPDVDVREYVTAKEFLEQGYGPNGALIAAVDKIIEYFQPLTAEILEAEPELIIFDTPGQMELFTHRPRGEMLVKYALGANTALLFLYDPVVAITPEGYVSLAFLEVSVRVRMPVTTLSVLSKADLLSEEQRDYVLRLASDLEFLESELSERAFSYARVMRNVFKAFKEEFLSDLIPASAFDDPGVDMLRGEIEEVLGLAEPKRYVSAEVLS